MTAKIQKYLHSGGVALQFLTQIPIKFKRYPNDETVGASLLFYPLVGLIIGGGLTALSYFSSALPSLFTATVLLLFWVAITGALHLDGLADTCDAWLGGIAGNSVSEQKQRTLDIMKDPCSGPIAVVVLVCLLLLKFVSLYSILESQHWSLLLVAPLISRSVLPVFLLVTPYVRAAGLAAILVKNAPRKTVFSCAGLGLILALCLSGVWVLMMALATCFVIRHLAMQRLQGITGDIAGAQVEIVEAVVLISIVYSIY